MSLKLHSILEVSPQVADIPQEQLKLTLAAALMQKLKEQGMLSDEKGLSSSLTGEQITLFLEQYPDGDEPKTYADVLRVIIADQDHDGLLDIVVEQLLNLGLLDESSIDETIDPGDLATKLSGAYNNIASTNLLAMGNTSSGNLFEQVLATNLPEAESIVQEQLVDLEVYSPYQRILLDDERFISTAVNTQEKLLSLWNTIYEWNEDILTDENVSQIVNCFFNVGCLEAFLDISDNYYQENILKVILRNPDIDVVPVINHPRFSELSHSNQVTIIETVTTNPACPFEALFSESRLYESDDTHLQWLFFYFARSHTVEEMFELLDDSLFIAGGRKLRFSMILYPLEINMLRTHLAGDQFLNLSQDVQRKLLENIVHNDEYQNPETILVSILTDERFYEAENKPKEFFAQYADGSNHDLIWNVLANDSFYSLSYDLQHLILTAENPDLVHIVESLPEETLHALECINYRRIPPCYLHDLSDMVCSEAWLSADISIQQQAIATLGQIDIQQLERFNPLIQSRMSATDIDNESLPIIRCMQSPAFQELPASVQVRVLDCVHEHADILELATVLQNNHGDLLEEAKDVPVPVLAALMIYPHAQEEIQQFAATSAYQNAELNRSAVAGDELLNVQCTLLAYIGSTVLQGVEAESKVQQNLIANSLATILSENISLSLFDDSYRHGKYAKASGLAQPWQRPPVIMLSYPFSFQDTTLVHEVNHCTRPDRNKSVDVQFLDEYAAYYTGFIAEHGYAPTVRSMYDICVDRLLSSELYDEFPEAIEKGEDAGRAIIAFLAELLGINESRLHDNGMLTQEELEQLLLSQDHRVHLMQVAPFPEYWDLFNTSLINEED